MLKKIDVALKKFLKIIDDNVYNIAPKVINDKNISCNFCPFKEVCFVNPSDYIYLDKKEGEIDA